MGRLSTFPISLAVADRVAVVVGGGKEAAAKARLLALTRARVRLVAAAIEPETAALAQRHGFELVERPISAADFTDAVVAFVATGTEQDDRLAAALARAAGVPVNVVDRPELCDFLMPAIVERAPLTVAISTEGAGPVFARLLRARIEAMLSPDVGVLLALAASLRDRVAARFADALSRRRFWEAFFGSGRVEAALKRGGLAGRHAAERLLAEGADSTGIVHLVGAGPGAIDLLTLRAQRVLQAADVIVHDALVPEEIIAMGRRDAERIAVGKRKGGGVAQSDINDLLVHLARAGRRVVRLKSGDPMIYGRAGEEIAALVAAAVPFEIVPGVTAALAAAAETATPVTHRRLASSLVFATGHGADGEDVADWVGLARSGATLALYMAKSVADEVSARLIAAGLPPDLPVGAVENASQPGAMRLRGTLAELPALAARQDVTGPVLILIGRAVAAGVWPGALPFAEAAGARRAA